MKNKIVEELEHHIPFTAFGALTGIILMFLFRNIPHETAHKVFYTFHPLHIILSAIATTAMFKKYQCTQRGFACGIWALILVGYVGSVGIATLSDSLIPFIGEKLLRLPRPEAHIGFIEGWYLVNPAAFLGIAIAFYVPRTRVPHTGHVLLSTWASLFHMLMALGGSPSLKAYFGIFGFLFISVWIPCCISDIVFPLLVVRTNNAKHR